MLGFLINDALTKVGEERRGALRIKFYVVYLHNEGWTRPSEEEEYEGGRGSESSPKVLMAL